MFRRATVGYLIDGDGFQFFKGFSNNFTIFSHSYLTSILSISTIWKRHSKLGKHVLALWLLHSHACYQRVRWENLFSEAKQSVLSCSQLWWMQYANETRQLLHCYIFDSSRSVSMDCTPRCTHACSQALISIQSWSSGTRSAPAHKRHSK